MDGHAVLGNAVGADGQTRIYTRTIVLWAVGISIDTDLLWEHVEVEERPTQTVPLTDTVTLDCTPSKRRRGEGPSATRPVVVMMGTAAMRRGHLEKRMKRPQTFRSVLSMDIAYRGSMPNLKVSNRNTIQLTGCQDLAALGDILHHLVTTYEGRGFTLAEGASTTARPGFVGDVVLANVYFRLGFKLDRGRLRDAVNDRSGGMFLASYEPLVRDVSVNIKFLDDDPLPMGGAVYPRWTLAENRWTTVNANEAIRLAPHVNLKCQEKQVQSLRVFASGSVIQIGRWPGSMTKLLDGFREYVNRIQSSVADADTARQRTLDSCWHAADAAPPMPMPVVADAAAANDSDGR